ncbi:MAG: hypothetical protein NZ611_03605 [Bacteroidia bacterium]|nr:hypothetical protein [Bacteroidia bacterium]
MQKKWLIEWMLPFFLCACLGVLYFLPHYQGYRFRASDYIQVEYMTYPLKKLHEKTKEPVFWTPHLFSGMPAYLVHYVPDGIYFPTLFGWLIKIFAYYPPMIFFIGAMGFFIFLRVEGIAWSWALMGAFGFVLTSYYTNMIVAAHWGKSNVLFSVPYVLAGMGLLHRDRVGWGVFFSLIGWAGMAGGGHPQMAYYALTVIAAYELFWLWEAWKGRQWRAYLTSAALVALCAAIGALSQANALLPYYEYGRYSIRGGSELERDREKDIALQSGLDKGYAQSYSATRAELWTLIIPDFVGGTSQEDILKRLGRTSALATAFQERGIQDMAFLRAVPTYWGGSPFSSGSFYASAVAFFFMLLGWTYGLQTLDWILLYVGWIVLQFALGAYGYSLWATPFLLLLPVGAYLLARRQKVLWKRTLLAASIFFGGWALISAIDNAPESAYKLTDWALEYLPFYNKFRAPSTWLVVAGFIFPWLALRGVRRFLELPHRENLLTALSVTGAIFLGVGFGAEALGFSFEGAIDETLRRQSQLPEWFLEALREDRITLARQSALRSLFWVVLAGGVLFLFISRRLSGTTAGFLSALVVLLDGWLLNSAYFPKRETYIRTREVIIPPPPAPHEEYILKDSSFYRVLPLHANPFTDARPSVFFENAGGYHPAKLKRYQQFIEAHLSRLEPEALKMLAIRYITAQPGTSPPSGYDSVARTSDDVVIFKARDSLPMAWLVEEVRVFPRTDQTLDSIGKYPVHRVALVAQRDWEKLRLRPENQKLDPMEGVTLLKRTVHELEYRVRARTPRLLVLSEVYYPPDWEALVNGERVPIIPANFILRAVAIPAGESTVQMFCRSHIYERGRRLSLIGSSMAWGLVVLSVGWSLRRRKGKNLISPSA